MFKRLFLFSFLPSLLLDKDTGDGGSGGTETPPAGGETTPAGGGAATGQIVFPNEAALMERIKREGRSQFNELVKELGFEKPEDLKVVVTKHKETEAASKTDLQKAQDLNQTLQNENVNVKKAAEKTLIDANLLVQATSANVKVDRMKAFLKLVDSSAITISNGVIDETTVKTAIENTLKDFPEFLKPKTDENGGEDFSAGGGGQKNLEDLPMAEYIKARQKAGS